VQPAGTYTVETDEELLQTLSVPAYRRISTLMRLPARPAGTMQTQIIEINPLELAAVLARDAQPNKTTPQPTRGDGVVSRESTAVVTPLENCRHQPLRVSSSFSRTNISFLLYRALAVNRCCCR
jgi:hypothetical protein